MERYLVLGAILIGLGNFVGVYLQPLLNGILILMILIAGLFYMFRARLPRWFWRNFLIMLVGPIIVYCLLGVFMGHKSWLFPSTGVIDPFWVTALLVALMLLASGYVIYRHRSHQIDSYQLQGAEREPVLPGPRQELDSSYNARDKDEKRL